MEPRTLSAPLCTQTLVATLAAHYRINGLPFAEAMSAAETFLAPYWFTNADETGPEFWAEFEAEMTR